MKLHFWKYQGTGNDFILLDGRNDVSAVKGNQPVIASLCDRKFGIGADGLIILEADPISDFRMVYYNADGADSSMCGNGGRCSIAFARFLGFSENSTVFNAVDGKHEGRIFADRQIELGMMDVQSIERLGENIFSLDTGSPHYVYFAENNEDLDIITFGKSIRYNEEYKEKGININVVKERNGGIYVETYERGVEDETLSCGTGVTACAIAYSVWKPGIQTPISIFTKGGNLTVSFEKRGDTFEKVTLSGPVKQVFEGDIEI
jgi:diaminopimelate epimerase